jgi:hypothetical protein
MPPAGSTCGWKADHGFLNPLPVNSGYDGYVMDSERLA